MKKLIISAISKRPVFWILQIVLILLMTFLIPGMEFFHAFLLLGALILLHPLFSQTIEGSEKGSDLGRWYSLLGSRKFSLDSDLDTFAFEADFEGVILRTNQAIRDFLQLPEKEIVGKKLVDYVHTEDVNRVQSDLLKLLDGHSVQGPSIRFRKSDGSDLWTLWTLNSDVTERKIYGFGVDSSIDRKIHEENENALRLFHLSFEHAPVAMLLMGEDRTIESINDAALQMINRSREAVVGKSGGESFCCANLADGGICGELDACSHCSLGSRVDASFNLNRDFSEEKDTFDIVDVEGNTHRLHLKISSAKIRLKGKDMVLLCIDDVSAIEKTKRQLSIQNENLSYLTRIHSTIIRCNDRESFLSNIFDDLIDHKFVQYCWLSVYGEEGGLVEYSGSGNEAWDEKLKQIFGDTSLGMPPSIKRVQENNCPLAMDSSDPEFEGFELFKVFPNSLSLCLPLGQVGTTFGYLSFVLTMDAREDSFTSVLDTISEDIAFSLQYLHNKEKLVTACVAAEKATLAKDEFLSVMSHELLTPLNPINGYASLLQERISDPIKKGYLDEIIKGSDRLSKIVNNMLELIDLQNNRAIYMKSDVNVSNIVQDLKNTYKADNNGLLVTLQNKVTGLLEISPEDRFLCDPAIIRSTLDKLLDNAFKFTKNGFIEIGFGYSETEESLVFHVVDSGVGIKESKQDTIFNQFTTGDSSNTRLNEGAGLGLSICRHYMDLVKGQIGVESDIGIGSKFWFSIPATRTKSSTPSSSDAKNGVAMLKPGESKGIVLVVDDSPVNCKMLSILLKRFGFDCICAEDGQSGLEISNDTTFDLILLDIHMPFMSGDQLGKMIRMGYGKNKNTPIIGVTADASNHLMNDCLESGFDGWQLKPVVAEQLKLEINRVLENPTLQMKQIRTI